MRGCLGDGWTRPGRPVAPPWTPISIPTAGELLRDNLRRRLRGLGRGLSSLAHSSRTLRRARRAWSAWREAFAERAPREQSGQARGNQDAVMMVPLPLGEPDPVRRLDLIAAETAARKQRARPQLGNVTLAVAVFSYAGQLNLTAVADQDTCPDLEVFAEGVRSALDGLARSMLVRLLEEASGASRTRSLTTPTRGGVRWRGRRPPSPSRRARRGLPACGPSGRERSRRGLR